MSVREQIGAFAAPDVIHWAPGLPKTRSGALRPAAPWRTCGAPACCCSSWRRGGWVGAPPPPAVLTAAPLWLPPRPPPAGKIMRRVLRKIASFEEDQLGDTSTLADPSVVDTLLEMRGK